MKKWAKYNVESIWKRLKKKVDLTTVQGRTPKEWRKNFIQKIKDSGNGRVESLLSKKGFISFSQKSGSLPRESRIINRVSDQKTIILTGKGKTKTFKTSNIKIKHGFYKGRETLFVSNIRTGKRVTSIILGKEKKEE